MSLSPERIAGIRAAEQAATPGPWYLVGDHVVLGKRTYVVVIQRKHSLQWRGADGCLSPPLSNDRHFIALAREAVPELLAEVERLRAQNAVLRTRLGLADRIAMCLDAWHKHPLGSYESSATHDSLLAALAAYRANALEVQS